MFLRATIVAGATALLALTGGGTAHASCLDDLQAGLDDGYPGDTPKSQYYASYNYFQYAGTATLHVYGDAFVSDHVGVATDWVVYTETVAGNAPDGATEFVDCVAG